MNEPHACPTAAQTRRRRSLTLKAASAQRRGMHEPHACISAAPAAAGHPALHPPPLALPPPPPERATVRNASTRNAAHEEFVFSAGSSRPPAGPRAPPMATAGAPSGGADPAAATGAPGGLGRSAGPRGCAAATGAPVADAPAIGSVSRAGPQGCGTVATGDAPVATGAPGADPPLDIWSFSRERRAEQRGALWGRAVEARRPLADSIRRLRARARTRHA